MPELDESRIEYQPSPPMLPDETTIDRIRRRAYELWEQEGRPEGHADEHWIRAEREIMGKE